MGRLSSMSSTETKSFEHIIMGVGGLRAFVLESRWLVTEGLGHDEGIF